MDSTNQLLSNIREQIETYKKDRITSRGDSVNNQGKPLHISYGTAGFRGLVSQIEHIFFNVGLVSGLKCIASNSNIGIMITASHNPVQDNGVKLIEGNGEMLDVEWEQVLENFCNTHDTDQSVTILADLMNKFGINHSNKLESKVLIGMDTRPSSEALVGLVKRGLEAWKSIINSVDYGLVTTPVLHYLVAESNKDTSKTELPLESYYNQLIKGLVQIFDASDRSKPEQLVVDCANGVGFLSMTNFINDPRFSSCFPLESIINGGQDDTKDILNKFCGADYVKTCKRAPSNANNSSKVSRRFASLDGDADRVVYFYLTNKDNSEDLKLLDGDKIMALYSLYLKELLVKSKLDDKLKLGCVQTAYANGASTDYLRMTLKIPVDCVDTGVKNLHKRALMYDLGVYFEANGHGTIWISDKARTVIEQRCDEEYFKEFRKLFRIINNYTGDAISDVFVVEAILKSFNWDIRRWDSIYEDRPNSLVKVQVDDRNVMKTTNAGRTCLEPVGLQGRIDEEVSKLGEGVRAFVRPSGTEDVIRVYSEAPSQDAANQLAHVVSKLVQEFCNKK